MVTPKGTVPWNAGRGEGWTDKRGYRWTYVSENGKRRARREHRVLMEAHLGRRLEPWEVVHHKDGNPANNALENLEVKDFGAHTSEHSNGSRKSYEARRSMEAFALMRESLKEERRVKADLLAALRLVTAHCDSMRDFVCEGGSIQMVGARRAVNEADDAINDAYAAIAKAEGR